jgi:hypothetical protein
MGTEMVERVARALEPSLWSPASGPVVWTAEKREAMRLQARHLARAAIEAMREPTEAMVAAGIAQARDCTDNWSASAPCVAECLFPVMIDAALAEDTTDR